MAQNMVKVSAFLAEDPGWLERGPATALDSGTDSVEEQEEEAPVEGLRAQLSQAQAQPDPQQPGAKKSDTPALVGSEFQAGALRQGVEQFGNLVQTVDFPAFVSGLIHGVFQAIVDASIQQMHAYGELLAATAKSVDEFAQDDVTADQARDHLVQRHPRDVRITTDGQGNRRLALTDQGSESGALARYSQDGRTTPDLSDPESEAALLSNVRLQLARSRMKLLAMMVLMGINRIVVTNGRINAKVIFDVKASDQAKRDYELKKSQSTSIEAGAAAAGWAPWGAAGGYTNTSHKTTVQSALDDTSESKAAMKAQLSGDVRVNFKSETLPPESMVNAMQMGVLEGLAGRAASPPAGAAAAPAAPAATDTNRRTA